MASLNAIAIANTVKKKVSNGERVNMRQIIKDSGAYSPYIANQPTKITKTLSYRNAIEPFIKRLEKHRDKIMSAMEAKDLTLEDYRILSESYDRMTKNLNLIQGKATENIATTVTMVNYADLPPEPRTSEVVQPNDTVITDGKDIDISE